MEWYRKLLKAISHALELSGRARAMAELRRMPPPLLRSAGLSPELLEQGLGAWPWRLKETATATSPVVDQTESNGQKAANASKRYIRQSDMMEPNWDWKGFNDDQKAA